MYNKYYYYYQLDSNIDEIIKKYLERKANNKDLKFVIIVAKSQMMSGAYKKLYNEIIKKLYQHIGPYDISVSVYTKDHYYSTSDWLKIKEAGEFFKKYSITFGFEDMNKTWSVKEVEIANSKIMSSANEIKKMGLSPFESLMAAYLKVTSRKYTSEEENDHWSTSRSVYGALNGGKIVCTGYSQILKAIIDELGEENIIIYTNHVAVSWENEQIDGYHSNVILYIKDEKYGINGYYYLDPTWDSNSKNISEKDLAHFMVPLKDINKIRGNIISDDHVFPNKDPEDKKPQNGTKKNTSKSDEIYNNFKIVNATRSVSFTSDGFQLTQKFVKDLLKIYPEFETYVREKYRDEQVNKTIELINSTEEQYKDLLNQYKQDIYYFESVKELFKEYGITYLTLKEETDLMLIDFDSDNNKKLDEIIDFLDKTKQAREEIMQKYPDAVSRFVDAYKNYYKQRIEGLNKNIEEQLRNCKEIYQLNYNGVYEESIQKGYSPEQAKEITERINGKTFEESQEYLTFISRKSVDDDAIKECEDILMNKTPIIEQFVKYHPESHPSILALSDEEISDCIFSMDLNIRWGTEEREYAITEEDKEIFDKEITNRGLKVEKYFSQIDDQIASKKEFLESVIQSKNKFIKSYSELGYDENLNEDIVQYIMRNQNLVKDFISKKSTPVLQGGIANALKAVLSKKYKQLGKDHVYRLVKEIMDYNFRHAPKEFKDDASICFCEKGMVAEQGKE